MVIATKGKDGLTKDLHQNNDAGDTITVATPPHSTFDDKGDVKTATNQSSLNTSNQNEETQSQSSETALSASFTKVKKVAVTTATGHHDDITSTATGYRLLDLSILGSIFSSFACPECCVCDLKLMVEFLVDFDV